MFKLLRYYAVASFIAILAAAVLLGWFYRRVSIEGIVRVAEGANLNLARAAMNPIKAELLAFLEASADVHPGQAVPPLPPPLAEALGALMHPDHFVARIKIYNLRGAVVFSTQGNQIGDDQGSNAGYLAATRGGVSSELLYRDTFNTFDAETETANLVETYLPISTGPGHPVRGVFELYGDVNALVLQTQRMLFIIVAGATPILFALYAALLLIVRRANRTVEQQQHTIHERNETLALMAARMLRTEESFKKQVALDLHEGVAQTLAAVKLKVEVGRRHTHARDHHADSTVPLLQDAIQVVRAIATDLRPSSLDDLGLLPTLAGAQREFERKHPGVEVRQTIALRESDIPVRLKEILHRICADAFDTAGRHAEQGHIALALGLEDDRLVLAIDLTLSPLAVHAGCGHAGAAPWAAARLLRMNEFTTLSGGTFTARAREDGGIALRSAWTCEEPPLRR
ncbi:MAG: histidine kinase [Ramlibacter sp.]|nr:histidine kinase [Ramlibacter sp.]